MKRRERIKILAITASPRRGGNSETLLKAFLEGVSSGKSINIEKLSIANLKISPCTECNECYKEGNCVLKDDMTLLYPKLLETEAIVISTPTFFMGPPAQLKAFIDRCQALWIKKYYLKQNISPKFPGKRKGFLIEVCASSNEAIMCQGTKNSVKALFNTLDIEYSGELLVGGVEGKDDTAKKKTLRERAFRAGREFGDSI